MVLVQGVGWRVEVAGQDDKAMYICETPHCGITYFDARCFVLHLEAHSEGFVQEVSPNTPPPHPLPRPQQWKRALAALEEQQQQSMPVLAKLLEANPILAKKLDEEDATSFLLGHQSAAFVSCLVQSYLVSLEYCVQGEADSVDVVPKEEAMRLLQAWNSEAWCQGSAERRGHVQSYRNWRVGIDEQPKADDDENVPQSQKVQQPGTEKLVLELQSVDSEREKNATAETYSNWREGDEETLVAPQSHKASVQQKAAVHDELAFENEQARLAMPGAEQLVLEFESSDQGRKRKKNATTEKARMAMLHFGKARWKLLAKPRKQLIAAR